MLLGGRSLEYILYSLIALLVAATVHEFAHAATAVALGDPTPKAQGRLTLNPLAHLDLIGSLLILLVGFGWAKPVEVNPLNFRDWRRAMRLVALAGPMANILVVLLLGMPVKLGAEPFPEAFQGIWLRLIFINININAMLAIFNLIPVPPLDGSKILASFFPGPFAVTYARMQPYGLPLLLLLSFTPALDIIISPPIAWLVRFATLLPIG